MIPQTYRKSIDYLPASILTSIKGKVFSNPFVNLTKSHLFLGGLHGEADQCSVGIWRLLVGVVHIVGILEHLVVIFGQLVHVCLLVHQQLLLRYRLLTRRSIFDFCLTEVCVEADLSPTRGFFHWWMFYWISIHWKSPSFQRRNGLRGRRIWRGQPRHYDGLCFWRCNFSLCILVVVSRLRVATFCRLAGTRWPWGLLIGAHKSR